jgi:hypothetical protein
MALSEFGAVTWYVLWRNLYATRSTDESLAIAMLGRLLGIHLPRRSLRKRDCRIKFLQLSPATLSLP